MENRNNLGSSALNLSLATLGQTATQFCGLKFLGDGSHGRSGAVIRLAPTYASASFQVRGEDKDLASVVWEIALAAFQAVAAEPPRASPAEFVEGLNRTLKIGTAMARPLAWLELALIISMFGAYRARPNWVMPSKI